MVPNQATGVTNNRRPAWNGRPSPAGVESPAPSPHNRGGSDPRRGRSARNSCIPFVSRERAAVCLEPLPGDRRAAPTCPDIRRSAKARGTFFSDAWSRGSGPRRQTREGAAARAEWARAALSPSLPHTAARADNTFDGLRLTKPQVASQGRARGLLSARRCS